MRVRVTFTRTMVLEQEIEVESIEEAEKWASIQCFLPYDFDILKDDYEIERVTPEESRGVE